MVKSKLVVVNNLNTFLAIQKSSEPIPNSAIVFIKNEGQIWTKGSYFGVQKTYSTVSKTDAGLAPKGGDSASSLISDVDTEWVLTVTSGASPSWRKLPANAFKNTTYTFYNLAFKNSAGTTVDTYKPTTSPTKTIKAGSNVTISAADNVVTIAATDTTYSVMTGSSTSADGASGLVPKPTKGNNTKFLRADGTWATPENTTYEVVTSAKDGLVPKFSLNDGTIDAQDTDWVLTNNNGQLGWYKLPVNAFNNSTYSIMKGASDSANGEYGLVPTPNKGQQNYLLSGSGSWVAPYSLPKASTSALGGIKVGSVNTNAFADLTGKYYTVNVDKNGLGYVNIPWSDTTYTASDGISLSNTQFSLALNSTTKLTNAIGGTIYALSLDKNGKLCVSVPWTNTWRDIYVGGNSKVGTANNTKAINFEAGDNISITHLASGTSSGQSGSTSYSTIKIANTYSYSLPKASSTLGGVKTTSTVSSTTGLTACPIIDGVVYYKDSDSNTWRGIYVGGTSKMGTATNTKALNFAAGNNVTISYAAPGTASGQSGKADYGTLTINATNTWTAWAGATDSKAGTAGYMPAPTSALRNQFLRGDGTWQSLNNYSLPTATASVLGGIKVGTTLTDTTGYTKVHIKDGFIYYKDTNSTDYLPLSGGTMNDGAHITMKSNVTSGNWIGSSKWEFFAYSNTFQFRKSDYDSDTYTNMLTIGPDSFTFKDQIVYHSGNITTALSNYVDLSSDQIITGKKTFSHPIFSKNNIGIWIQKSQANTNDTNYVPYIRFGKYTANNVCDNTTVNGELGVNDSKELVFYKGTTGDTWNKVWHSGNLDLSNYLSTINLTGSDDGRYTTLNNSGFSLHAANGGWAMGIETYKYDGTHVGGVCGAFGTLGGFSYWYYGGYYNAATMYIKDSKLGIGTNDPKAKLHIKQGNMFLCSSATPYIAFKNDDESSYYCDIGAYNGVASVWHNNRGWETILTSGNWSSYITSTGGGSYLPLTGGSMTGTIDSSGCQNAKAAIKFRNQDSWHCGMSYDTNGNECILLWAQNTVTRFRWHAGTNYTTFANGNLMSITPDFEISKASGSATGYIAGDTILTSKGGTMNAGARIGHAGTGIYLGNSANDGWIYTQDICSHDGHGKWCIYTNGNAHFTNLYLGGLQLTFVT